MTQNHREIEQLSAYLDGELDAAELTALETHLAGCATCSETLAALRATAADLQLLADVESSEQDAWALRSAIARARREQRIGGPRWSRVLAASSASAAALALIVGSIVFLGGGSNERGGIAGGPEVQSDGADTAALSVEMLGASLDQDEARALFFPPTVAASRMQDDNTEADLLFEGEFSEARPAAPGAPAEGPSHEQRIAACEASLFGTDGTERIARRYVVARYNDVDAYFLLYFLPEVDKLELWVIARSGCDNVLLFEQRDA